MDLEKKTIEAMIDIYCKENHYDKNKSGTSRYLRCPICDEQAVYALMKIDQCPYKENKPVCSKCLVKCYNVKHKDNIKQVMRYSGPRMIFKHPLLLIRYVFRKKTKNVQK